MRKLIIAATTIAALAVPAVTPALASAQGTSNLSCTGSMGGTITQNVTVPAGATCDFGWSDVKGNVDVYGTVNNFGPTHFEANVTVHPGGHFKASNYGVTLDKNLSITDPATYSDNGFWGPTNVIHGNVNYTITSAAAYPNYQAPYLYFGGGTQVDGSVTYTDNGSGFHGGFDQRGLTTGKGVTVIGAAS